jgi:proteasome lid subunit RPN8/RPN11
LCGTFDGDAIVFTKATSSNDERTANSLKLGLGDLAAIELLESWGMRRGAIGVVHSHPSGDWHPSPSDFTSWELAHAFANQTRWEPYGLGIIATRDEKGSWAFPTSHAWASREENGRYITEPARIVAV